MLLADPPLRHLVHALLPSHLFVCFGSHGVSGPKSASIYEPMPTAAEDEDEDVGGAADFVAPVHSRRHDEQSVSLSSYEAVVEVYAAFV